MSNSIYLCVLFLIGLSNANRTITLPLQFINNKYYTAKLFFGSNQQPANLIVATNTDWLYVTSNNCTDVCEKVSFNRDRSTTYDVGKHGHIYNNINFGDVVMLRGGNSTDQVVIGSNKSDIVHSYTFFEITDAKMRGMSNANGSYKFPFDGVLGLSLNPQKTADYPPEEGTPLALAMKANGLINQAIVAVDMRNESGSVTFGGYNESEFKVQDGNMTWIDVHEESWQGEVKHFVYENKTINDGGSNYAYFDSLLGGIHLPTSEFTTITNLMTTSHPALSCNYSSTSLQCVIPNSTCEAHVKHFSPLYLNFIGDQAFELRPEHFLYDKVNSTGGNYCQLLIYGNLLYQDRYIIGNTFMRQHYMVFDYENRRIGINGIQSTVEIHYVEPKIGGMPVWLVILIGAFILAIVVSVGACLIIKRKYRKLERNLAGYGSLTE
ncbi:hypothetical protein FGO68_gene16692 [Halteria grandinella]|uniref:Peptidase A1 domain-containing protein n=1 Tax=Halteria grandinella TaxID=5974 RepID=A0A8J8T1W6_HALGN|nr:hypothetical protein FGO68_gene16692 [Halteria grandinella]